MADGVDHPETTPGSIPDEVWSEPASQVADDLGVRLRDGLGPGEVESRRREFGENRLRESERRSAWQILVEQFQNVVVALLTVAAVVSVVFGHVPEAIAIGVVLVLNTMIGFATEYSAARSMEALRKMGDIDAKVIREGEHRRIHARELVPGDVVRLQRGDVVPADLRVAEATNLEVDESSLTGESIPVAKQTEPVDAGLELADRSSMVYRGTVVSRGSGLGLVVTTGVETELGEISELIRGAERARVPLEDRLERLGQTLVSVVVAVAALVGAAGWIAGRDLYLMLETSIALAVAAVPEGLPIVATVALAYGMWEMREHDALIRRLPSVETLGAATRICTDKTGTLTENRMKVAELATAETTYRVDRDGSRVSLSVDGEAVGTAENSALRRAVEVTVLANHASDDGPEDPMERALVELGDELGCERAVLLEESPLVDAVPFDTEVKMMATVHEVDDGFMYAVQGAPETIVDQCAVVFGGDAPRELTADRRRELLARIDDMADRGHRVIGLATKRTDEADAAAFDDLSFVGLVGLIDPPREDVAPAIEECHRAGIRTVMVTGDHPGTARNVADRIGLVQSADAEFLVGDDIEGLEAQGRDERRERLLDTEILARVTPQQKLTLIHLLQDAGEVVAMTGDGVNDAPALQNADIGVAMGQRGTEVAREASDMILLDDAFPTIVEAVERGRAIIENIRKFVVYLISGNIGEIALVGTAAVLGVTLPLLPLQILYLNVLNDVFPALALGVGPASAFVMDRPPTSGDTTVLDAEDWWEVVGFGLLIAVAVGTAFWVALGPMGWTTERAVTVSFLAVSTTRLLHVFNMRDPSSGPFDNEVTRNGYVWGALALDLLLLLAAVHVPVLSGVLSLTPPGTDGWLLVGASALAPLIVGQFYLRVRRLADE